MKRFIPLEELFKPNLNYYSGDCFYTKIHTELGEYECPFLKCLFKTRPEHYNHSLYKIRVPQPAVYIIRNIETHHFYVGSSCHVYRRLAKHRTSFNIRKHDNKNLENLLKTYNANDFEVFIFFVADRNIAYEIEQHYLDLNKNSSKMLNICHDAYPLTEGGYVPMTEEGIRKVAEANRGKKFSQETKQKLSESHKTSKLCQKALRKVHDRIKRKVNINGVQYDSIRDASVLSGIGLSKLSKILRKNKDPNIFYISNNVSPLHGRSVSAEIKEKQSAIWKNRTSEEKNRIKNIALEKLAIKMKINGINFISGAHAARYFKVGETTIRRHADKYGKLINGYTVFNFEKRKPKKYPLTVRYMIV